MSGISIIQGEIRVQGMVHGALNTMVIRYAEPDDWEFKQFVSQEQLDLYAAENNFAIVSQKENS